MLIDFSFSNYRSFKDEQSFSMKRDSRFDNGSFPGISTIAAIYGANASGKSNFLRAFSDMCHMVRGSYSQGNADTGVSRTPFALCAGAGRSDSMFFSEFLAEDRQRYQYWFRFNDREILEEHLTFYRWMGDRLSTHATLLFAREATDIDFGTAFKGPRAQVRKTIELRPNALALSAAAAAGIASIQSAYSFFASNVVFCDALSFESEQSFILSQFSQETTFAKHLTKLIRYADFGIDNVVSAPADIPESLLESIKNQMREQFGADDDKVEQIFGSGHQMQLRFEHVGDNRKALLSIGDESRGTLAALSFFSLVLRQLTRASVTLVDEIDTSLHPTLVQELVALFTDPETNPHGAQLIFTTHDASLIIASGSEERLICPDQMWLVEKTAVGASELYPVTDLKVRREENLGRNYLNGVYGAIPKPSFHAMFAQIVNEEDTDGQEES